MLQVHARQGGGAAAHRGAGHDRTHLVQTQHRQGFGHRAHRIGQRHARGVGHPQHIRRQRGVCAHQLAELAQVRLAGEEFRLQQRHDPGGTGQRHRNIQQCIQFHGKRSGQKTGKTEKNIHAVAHGHQKHKMLQRLCGCAAACTAAGPVRLHTKGVCRQQPLSEWISPCGSAAWRRPRPWHWRVPGRTGGAEPGRPAPPLQSGCRAVRRRVCGRVLRPASSTG